MPDYVFTINVEQNDWEDYNYLRVMIASFKFWTKNECFDDRYCAQKIPTKLREKLGGEISESCFEFYGLSGETIEQCKARCIKSLTDIGCLHLSD